jgi:hypothetical protein
VPITKDEEVKDYEKKKTGGRWRKKEGKGEKGKERRD